MPSLPTIDDLVARIGADRIDMEEDSIRLASALEDAIALVLGEVADTVADRWRQETPSVVRVVILKAARREFENPRGLHQETFGEHMVGLSETSGAYLTPRELAQILKAATGRRGGFVGSARTPSAYGPARPYRTFYVPVDGSRPTPWLEVPLDL
ncbi:MULTISPECIES: hypothetical protein [Bacteria]|uniref:hypothetical protein n=1 Tax=Bacteria TaxID=2 RepID=UPI003C7EC9D4